MGIDHRGRDLRVPQEFLNHANVIIRSQQIDGKRVAQRVAVDLLRDAGLLGGGLNGALQDAFMNMVASDACATGIHRQPCGGEDVLPAPLCACLRILARQRSGREDAADAVAVAFFFGCSTSETSTSNTPMDHRRASYEDSVRRLQKNYLEPGDIPPMPDRMPRYDDEQLRVSFFRTFVG